MKSLSSFLAKKSLNFIDVNNILKIKWYSNKNNKKHEWAQIMRSDNYNFKSGKANCKNQEDNLVDKAKYTGMWTQR